MNTTILGKVQSTPRTEAAKLRLLSAKGEPLVFVEWNRVFFLHFEVEPAVVRARLPAPFELELHRGHAVVSLVALTKRRFRPNPEAPVWGRIFAALGEQRFCNVRTYVRHRDEPGTFFFWSWLSRPWRLPLPARPFGLTCGFADSRYVHDLENGEIRIELKGRANEGRLTCGARLSSDTVFGSCPPGSLAEFALERYTGYFWHRDGGRIFRAWHKPWLQASVEAQIEEDALVARAFPWLEDACLVDANFAPGFDEVWLGRPHRLDARPQRTARNLHGSSGLFETP